MMSDKKVKLDRFIDKYTKFFEEEFGRTKDSYYRFFEGDDFPDDCEALGFDMDCGHSFVEAYGRAAWGTAQGVKDNIDKINDIQIIGSGLYSQWRYYNHWSSPSYANNDTKEWYLLLLQRMKDLNK